MQRYLLGWSESGIPSECNRQLHSEQPEVADELEAESRLARIREAESQVGVGRLCEKHKRANTKRAGFFLLKIRHPRTRLPLDRDSTSTEDEEVG